MTNARIHPFSVLCGGALATAVFLTVGMRPAPGGVTSEQFEILQHMTLVKLPDGQGGQRLTLRISDLNLQLVNGMGGTETTNGLGNLIVGYEEYVGGLRTGSHNIVGGIENRYSSYGGIVTGHNGRLDGGHAAVIGGYSNRASSIYATVLGGSGNRAEQAFSCVAGGAGGSATGLNATVVGGRDNMATGTFSTVSGGRENLASESSSSVGGGSGNEAAAENSTVTGGCGLSATLDCQVLP